MKKFFLLFAVAGMLVACGGNEEKKSGEDAAKKTEQTAKDPKVAPETPAPNDENVPDGDEGESEYGYEYGLGDEFANEAAYAAGEFGNHDEDYADLEGADFDYEYDEGKSDYGYEYDLEGADYDYEYDEDFDDEYYM